uniref:Uncharacterized protein n=1 Tax=Oryza meridionalis TaxID=40149 RepID=A0A0E0CJB9_9ORYZ
MQSAEARDALLNPAPAHPCLAATAGGFPSLVQPLRVQPYVAPPSLRRRWTTGKGGVPTLRHGDDVGHGLPLFDLPRRRPDWQRVRVGRDDVHRHGRPHLHAHVQHSSISSIALLSKLGVEDFSALEEKTVKIGYQEGLEILLDEDTYAAAASSASARQPPPRSAPLPVLPRHPPPSPPLSPVRRRRGRRGRRGRVSLDIRAAATARPDRCAGRWTAEREDGGMGLGRSCWDPPFASGGG